MIRSGKWLFVINLENHAALLRRAQPKGEYENDTWFDGYRYGGFQSGGR
jgi:hypothetical protein